MCDGDKALIIADQTLVEAAKRNTKDVVPLFYYMAKSGSQQLDNKEMYDGMIAAYTGGNIGVISNDISKIFNGAAKPNIDAVKWLVMENNFVIDFAKTRYKPTRPDHIDSIIKSCTGSKVPHFFLYAKDKTEMQVAQWTTSPVNRLRDIIPVRRLKFDQRQLGKFDPRMLMHSKILPNNEVTQKIIEVYDKHMRKQGAARRSHGDDEPMRNWPYQDLLNNLLAVYNDKVFLTDVLVKHLFIDKRTKRKNMFWVCFGDVVSSNLKENIGTKSGMCVHCGSRFIKESNRQVMCPACAAKQRRSLKAASARRARIA